MQGSGADNGRHSTSAIDDLRRQRWKVWGALVLAGLLFGLMLGRLFGPASLPTSAPQLLAVGESEQGLVLRFDRQAAVTAARVEGALTLRIVARGAAQQGDGRWLGQPLRWRVREEGKALLLSLVSTRPCRGAGSGRRTARAGAWSSNCRSATAGNKRGILSLPVPRSPNGRAEARITALPPGIKEGSSQPACTEVPETGVAVARGCCVCRRV